MNGRFLLDTNIVVARFNEEGTVLDQISAANAVFVPSIVVGELYFGARKSGRVEANVARVDDMVKSEVIVNCDAETARRYAIIKNQLRLKGKPIPENDIWIAAVALQHGLTLATRDAHFGEVENLSIETW